MLGRVLGLGTVAMDIVIKCNKLPQKDGTAIITKEELMPGGSCANVLVTLSKLGIDTEIIAKTGDDHYSKLFMEDIRKSGVSTKYMKVDRHGTMLHTFITIAENGEKAVFSNLGTSLLSLLDEDVNEDMVSDISIFYTDMFPGKPALKLARLCKAKRIPIVFNLQCDLEFMELCHVSKKDIEEMIRLSDIFISCSEGLFQLSKENTYERAIDVLYSKYKPGEGVVATCGDRGVMYANSKGIISAPSFKVEAIDTTGAGDSFMGGLIYYYFMKEESIENSLRFGNACSAIKCTQLGGRIDTSLDKVLELYNTIK